MNIYFDKSLKSLFIDSLNLTVKDGYLFDSKNNEQVADSNKQPIKVKNFGGYRKGSKIYLSNDIDTVIKEAELDSKKVER